VDPGLCREHLGSLLTDETHALSQLEEALQHEREVLEARDVAAVEHAAFTRQQQIAELARLESERRALCSMHGHTPDKTGLDNLMKWCDSQGSLSPKLRECFERATRCRELNERNGILVAARLKHVEGRLAVLKGRGWRPDTYSSDGAASPERSPGRALGAA